MPLPKRIPKPTARIEVEKPVPNLAAVLEKVAESSLSSTRKRDCVSALNRYGKLVGRNLDEITADVPTIRASFAGLHPSRHGLTQKSWSNLRSDLLTALKVAGVVETIQPRRAPVSAVWHLLRQEMEVPAIRYGLSRFTRFCSANGIDPKAVTLDVVERYAEVQRAGTLSPRGNSTAGTVIRLWNRFVGLRPDLGLPSVIRPNGRASPIRLREDLPASFVQDLDSHLSWAACRDPFAPDARPYPLSPGSLRLREQYISTAAGELVASGERPRDTIRSLADLVTPEAFKVVLSRRHEKAGGKITAYDHGLAGGLFAIAKEWVRPDPASLAELKKLRGRVRFEQKGLTPKNQTLLREFDDPGLLKELKALPGRLLDLAERRAPSARALAEAQAGIAIAILTYAPVRIANLVALELGRTIRVHESDSRESLVSLPAAEVKNREDFVIPLPPVITALLRRYRSRILGPLGLSRSPYMFDSGKGRPKDAKVLSDGIQWAIKRHIGIKMTAHQFRHFAAKMILDHDQGAYEVVRQLLGHKNMKTTVSFYAGLNTARAGRRFASILDAEEEPATQPKRRTGRDGGRRAR